MRSYFCNHGAYWILAFVCALAGCTELNPLPRPPLVQPPPPPQDIPVVSHTFALELINKRQVSGLTLRIFNTGKLLSRGEIVSSFKSWHAKITLDIPVFLIQHPKQGLILFETGLSPDESRRPKDNELLTLLNPSSFRFRMKKGQDIVSQLSRTNIPTSDIRWIFISHLQVDTAGMIDAFPEATVVLSKKEWEWHQAETDARGQRGMDWSKFESKIKLKLVDVSTAPIFGAFEHGLDFFEDGTFFLVELPGATPGNMGAWVNLDGGPVLFAGGASLVVDNYLDLALPVQSQIHNLEQYWHTLHRIRAVREAVPRLVVFPGHDLAPITLSGRSDLPVIAF